jgi:hypothetical protein
MDFISCNSTDVLHVREKQGSYNLDHFGQNPWKKNIWECCGRIILKCVVEKRVVMAG